MQNRPLGRRAQYLVKKAHQAVDELLLVYHRLHHAATSPSTIG